MAFTGQNLGLGLTVGRGDPRLSMVNQETPEDADHSQVNPHTQLQLIESDTCLSGAELGERGWVFSLSSLEPAGTSTTQMISSQRMAEPQDGRNLGP